MIVNKIESAINKQMNLELHSAYIYLSMSAYFDSINLDGFAHWMRLQAQEELGHSLKLYDYLLEREGTVELTAVKAPPAEWKSPLAACQDALKHERVNTKQINVLMELAFAANDHATRVFLQWFVTEQVEEEASASKLVEKVKLAKDDKGALFILDQELGKRLLTE
ncbi:MAG: ferritin [Candidatus Krumholzibacteria bacterium]|nr:ferritin [Candidatus Krumholzibacteria bacterium]